MRTRLLPTVAASVLGAIVALVALATVSGAKIEPSTLRTGSALEVSGGGLIGSTVTLYDEVGAINTGAVELRDDRVTIETPYLIPAPHRLEITRTLGPLTLTTEHRFTMLDSFSPITDEFAVNTDLSSPVWAWLLAALLLVIPSGRFAPLTRAIGAALATLALGAPGAVLAVLVTAAGLAPKLVRVPKQHLSARTVGVAAAAAVVGLGTLAGVAVVQAVAPSAGQVQCIDWDGDRCQGFALTRLMETSGKKAGMDVLGALLANDSASCHGIAHWAGRYAAQRTELDGLYEGITPHCEWGYLHGAAEEVSQLVDDEDWTRFVPLCNGVDPRTDMFAYCGHGIGHAALRRHTDINKAIADCTPLREPARASCQGAALMEWAAAWIDSREAANADPVRPDLRTPVEICAETPVSIADICYYNVWNTTELFKDRTRTAEYAAACSTAPAEHRQRCAEGFGVGVTTKTRDSSAVAVCDLTGDPAACRLGIASSLVGVYLGDKRDPLGICADLAFAGCAEFVESRKARDSGSLVRPSAP